MATEDNSPRGPLNKMEGNVEMDSHNEIRSLKSLT
jgi:hypothetical protein